MSVRCRVYSERTYVVYGNIMYDRRVIRGNTYAQSVIPSVRRLLLTCFLLFVCFCSVSSVAASLSSIKGPRLDLWESTVSVSGGSKWAGVGHAPPRVTQTVMTNDYICS